MSDSSDLPYPTVCITDQFQGLLTQGKVYIVRDESPFMLMVVTDRGTLEWFARERFNPNAMVTVRAW